MYQGFNHQKYLLRKDAMAIVLSKWSIRDSCGNIVFYCEEEASWKTSIQVYSNKDKQHEILSAKAREIELLDVFNLPTFDVWDPTTNEKIGALKREGGIRDTWIIMDKNDRKIGVIKEDSFFLALLRTLLRVVLMGWLLPKKYFCFIDNTPVCVFKKHFNPFVWKTSIDFSQDISNLLDRRLGIMAALLLCVVKTTAKARQT